MKRKELQEAKRSELAKIEEVRTSLKKILFEPTKLPDSVVNGAFTKVVEYKELCEKTATVYHINNAPGKSKTLKQLQEIRARLERLQMKIAA